MSYWDTSALVKLYVPEADSPMFERHAQNPTAPRVSARIAAWEARATFRRKEAEGVIQAWAGERLYRELLHDASVGLWRFIEMGADVETEFARALNVCFTQSPPVLIRTLDAIHLASARVANETEIVATDRRLREAAALLGFALFPK